MKFKSSYFVFFIIYYFLLNTNSVFSNNQKSFFLITVDTESLLREKFDLVDQWDVSINNVSCGINRMIQISDKYNAKITFYLNVYEFSIFGFEALKDISKKIQNSGHDIQLHTHPEFTFDKKKLKMYDYNLKEQEIIIETGKDLIYQWTNVLPVAHRAGTYSANSDTLKALTSQNIYFDSSYFFDNIYCKLNKDEFNTNILTLNNNLIEIPVNVFYYNEYYKIGEYDLPDQKRIKKFDIDSCDIETLEKSLQAYLSNDLQVISLFMHSWTFVKKWTEIENQRKADIDDINDFEYLLRSISTNNNIQFISTHDLYEKYKNNEIKLDLNSKDFIPNIRVEVDILTYFRRVFNINKNNFKYWILAIFLFILINVIFVRIIIKK